MKVALVHDWLTGMRGGEKCLEVFCELYPDADLFTLVYVPEKISSTIRRMNVRTSWLDRLPAAAKYFRYFLPLFPYTVERWDLSAYDLVLSSSHCVAKGVLAREALHVSYVHTPMRYIWDLHGEYFDRVNGYPGTRAGMSFFRSYLQKWDVQSSKRVDYFVANSANVAARIERCYGRSSHVIYPPVEIERFSTNAKIEPFYLIVSALVPYKRIELAVDAFNALGLPLKIVGGGPLRRRLERRAKANIEFLGWIDDKKVAELYASCQALIYPGEEDFGIAPLEAQASGRPVIAFRRGGALETVVGLGEERSGQSPTGIFFAEQSPASLISAIRAYEHSLDRFEPQLIQAHAAQFSRARFKKEIAAFVELRLRQYNRRAC